MIRYTNIRIYTSEKARHEGRPLGPAVLRYVHGLKIAARCAVFRGREGFYESGEMASDALTDLSYNLPLLIDILVPTQEAETILATLKVMVQDGIVGVLPVDFLSFRSERALLPPHLLVKDIMTQPVQLAHADFSVRTALEVMLDHNLKDLPVVDKKQIVIGIVTTRDLLAASMPVRVGLFPLLPTAEKEAFLTKAEGIAVTDIMTKNPVTITEDSGASHAVHLMVRKQKKRLPVVDQQGKLVGMLSRIDLMKAVSAEHFDPAAKAVSSEPLARTIGDIERQEVAPISERADLLSAIDLLVKQGEDQAAVVDQEGRLVGIVNDRELFGVLNREGWRMAVHRLFVRRGRFHQVVADIMKRDIVRLGQNATTEEALRLMVEKGLKRLPVVDAENRFVGMIRRDALLITLSHNL
jgi:CBS domain-containing protein